MKAQGEGEGGEGGREAVGTILILIMGFMSRTLPSGQNRFNIGMKAWWGGGGGGGGAILGILMRRFTSW